MQNKALGIKIKLVVPADVAQAVKNRLPRGVASIPLQGLLSMPASEAYRVQGVGARAELMELLEGAIIQKRGDSVYVHGVVRDHDDMASIWRTAFPGSKASEFVFAHIFVAMHGSNVVATGFPADGFTRATMIAPKGSIEAVEVNFWRDSRCGHTS